MKMHDGAIAEKELMMTNLFNKSTKMMSYILAGLMFVLVSGCSFGNGGVPDDGDVVWLALMGYNYTSHTIPDYSVNGTWGGGVRVSTPTSGGGGGTCCVRWRVGQDLPVKVHIKWVSHVCTYTEYDHGKAFVYGKSFYSERDVFLKGPIPKDPQYFETHFYPDGHIEVAVSSEITLPRLKLDGENGQPRQPKKWPECTPEQLQERSKP